MAFRHFLVFLCFHFNTSSRFFALFIQNESLLATVAFLTRPAARNLMRCLVVTSGFYATFHAAHLKWEGKRCVAGRTLAYAEYGASSGNVLFYFHGGADSRLEAAFLAEQAKQAGVRLLAPYPHWFAALPFPGGRPLVRYA